MSVTQELFRQAWGKFATGVSIVTTIQEDGRVHQMTANALCSVSLDPPLLLLCVGHQRSTYHNLKLSSRFGVNILARGQDEVASRQQARMLDFGAGQALRRRTRARHLELLSCWKASSAAGTICRSPGFPYTSDCLSGH